LGEIVSSLNLIQFVDASAPCSLSEEFPNSVIKAMAVTQLVVATPVGEVIDVFGDNVTGILVPFGNQRRSPTF
jgi:glycosyltransferase involved in cell wall biosynthesis